MATASTRPLRQPTLRDVGILIGVSALWGSSFLVIRVVVEGIPPSTLTTARLLVAAAVLLAYLRIRGVGVGGALVRSAIPFGVGLFGSALPYWLVSWAELTIPSGTAAILIAVGPLIALLLSHVMTTDDRITPRKLLGAAVGFAGILLVFGAELRTGGSARLLPKAAVLVAALGYALAGLLARRERELPSDVLTTAAVCWAAILTLPVSLIQDQPWRLTPDPTHVLALIYLGLVPTAFAFLVRFRQIVDLGYTFVSFAGFLVPIFGLLWGTLFLGETLLPATAGALALILAGLGISRSSRAVPPAP